MSIGVILPNPGVLIDLDTLLDEMARAEERGMQSIWVANVPRGFDALTLLALAGAAHAHRRTGHIRRADLSAPPGRAGAAGADRQMSAAGGRLVLGIGLSHRVVMEAGLGFDWSHPIRHMREYLDLPDRLPRRRDGDIRGRGVSDHELRHHRAGCDGAAGARRRARPADAAPRGAARGWHRRSGWAARAISRDYAVPTITAAASAAGRPAPRIVAGLPVCVTDARTPCGTR